eukprot:jgi/Mesvir1/26356/Mv25598-RA.4
MSSLFSSRIFIFPFFAGNLSRWQMRALLLLFPKILDLENFESAVMARMDVGELYLTRKLLAHRLFFRNRNPNGHYLMDLGYDGDAALASRLMELVHVDSSAAWYNVCLNGQRLATPGKGVPIEWRTVPSTGILSLDYATSSGIPPEASTTELELESLVHDLASRAAGNDRVHALRARSPRLSLTVDQAVRLLTRCLPLDYLFAKPQLVEEVTILGRSGSMRRNRSMRKSRSGGGQRSQRPPHEGDGVGGDVAGRNGGHPATPGDPGERGVEGGEHGGDAGASCGAEVVAGSEGEGQGRSGEGSSGGARPPGEAEAQKEDDAMTPPAVEDEPLFAPGAERVEVAVILANRICMGEQDQMWKVVYAMAGLEQALFMLRLGYPRTFDSNHPSAHYYFNVALPEHMEVLKALVAVACQEEGVTHMHNAVLDGAYLPLPLKKKPPLGAPRCVGTRMPPFLPAGWRRNILVACVRTECIGMYRNVSECIGMYRNVSECIGMYRNVSECIGMYRNVSECIPTRQRYKYVDPSTDPALQ